MSDKIELTGVYEVDVNGLISKLIDVQSKLKSCSVTAAGSQNFAKLWSAVNILHDEIKMLTDELREHEMKDDIIHTRQDEELTNIENTIHGLTHEEVKELKAIAKSVCEKARQTTLTLTNLKTGERSSLMTIDKDLINDLKECINY